MLQAQRTKQEVAGRDPTGNKASRNVDREAEAWTSAPPAGEAGQPEHRTPVPQAGGRRQFKRTGEEMFLESFGSIQNQIDIMRSGLIDLDNLDLDNPRTTACDLYAASNYLRKLAHRIEGT